MAAKNNIVAFRAEDGLREAIKRAARFHNVNSSLLIKSWIVDRLIAEGFAAVEGQTDGMDKTGDGGVGQGHAEPAAAE